PALCQSCICEVHQHLPFHQIKKWSQGFFPRCSLASLGLEIHLGHGGVPCP
ncbi:hypothetical protein M422DRAFT_129509, partial [Sphaerobolus stellatus SS14]